MLPDSICTLARADLIATDSLICDRLLSEVPLINELAGHILQGGGKRIRPLVALLAANAFDPPGHQQHIALAAAIELIHTATLLHDDVVDEASLRRGKKTANCIWGNEASVLVGDFLYSRAFQLVVGLQHPDVLAVFADSTNLIAEGEVMQLINRHDPDVTEAAYYDVIQRKTARLFEIASLSGTLLGKNVSGPARQAMQTYGMCLGTAYQLMDDILDYRASAETLGKNPGNDLAGGKLTLPLIHAMKTGTEAEKKYLRDCLQKGSADTLAEVLSIVESGGSIRYTAAAAESQIQQATDSLQHIPASPWRNALGELAGFVVARTS